MNYFNENFTNKKETQLLSTIIESKAEISDLKKLELQSLEMDKLVVDVEKQINSESQSLIGCKEALATQKG